MVTLSRLLVSPFFFRFPLTRPLRNVGPELRATERDQAPKRWSISEGGC
jgi:hypothetical protein